MDNPWGINGPINTGLSVNIPNKTERKKHESQPEMVPEIAQELAHFAHLHARLNVETWSLKWTQEINESEMKLVWSIVCGLNALLLIPLIWQMMMFPLSFGIQLLNAASFPCDFVMWLIPIRVVALRVTVNCVHLTENSSQPWPKNGVSRTKEIFL